MRMSEILSTWLFLYRLIEDEERHWTDENVDMVALKHFPSINKEEALCRPILFSNWLSKDYSPVDREELREYTKARLKVIHWWKTKSETPVYCSFFCVENK